MKFPFGKHRGEELDDIPEDYLAWVLDNIDDLRPTLRRAIEEVLGISSQPPPPPPPRSPPPPPAAPRPATAPNGVSVEQVIRAWHRMMSKKYHPDVGGSHEVMIAINEGAELLKKLAGLS